MSDQAAPGWYRDPSGEHQIRYWDGAAWTGMVEDGWRGPFPGGAEVLTAEDEAQLVRTIGRGRRAADAYALQNLKLGRTTSLEQTVRESNQAQRHLIDFHRHLVASIVQAYKGRGADLKTLFEEGKAALRRAAQVFDQHTQTRFAPYAAQRIHEAMVATLHDQDRQEDRPAAPPELTMSLDEYLATLQATKPLTAEEGVRLAQVIEKGKRAENSFGRTHFLMEKRMQKLKAAARLANDARKQFVDGSRHLVVPIAGEYIGRGVEMMGLIELGNHGLRPAIEQFNPKAEPRFSAHVEPFIRRAIERGLRRGGRGGAGGPGGSAGVREPRRPEPPLGSARVAVEPGEGA